jgi:hypothetical protein
MTFMLVWDVGYLAFLKFAYVTKIDNVNLVVKGDQNYHDRNSVCVMIKLTNVNYVLKRFK